MGPSQLNWIANFIWGIADDVLRDLYVRGKYRDVILPMTVLRRLDAVLEHTKQAVLDMKAALDKAGITNQDQALRQAAGQAFYNTSRFTLRDLKARASQQQLKADFEAWLDGFSPNVQEIIDNFEFRNQIPRLSKADALGTLIEKFLSPDINLSPNPVLNGDGSVKHPGLDNHGMGTVFEELVRRFNEENNEEAGEHWTPRDAVKLMAKLLFLPIAGEIESGTYLLYDGALGTGGMLTVAEETLKELAAQRGKQVATHLYGQEINAETYAICKADLLLKGEGDAADNIVGGPEHSTLSNDAFPSREFDFMLSNPPYGKSWKSDLERMGGKDGIKDPRFIVQHRGEELSLLTRSSDGQMLFLANMLSKMKRGTKLGSRIAEVHNGSSLFTGDAGQGESNIRRWIIENDWLEAIVALPLNMFYNTGIATYVWVLTNRKPAHRQGKVQLIDATQWFKPLRKNLSKKNCELSDDDVARICDTFLKFEETEQSKIFPNAAFGYWKVTVERPLRLKGIDPERAYTPKEIKALKETAERADDAPPVIRKIHKIGTAADPLRGLFETTIGGKPAVVDYEPDPDLRDTEQVPLLEEGGIEAFIRREVLPHAPDAWYVPESVKTGYEISFTRYFYKPQPLRTLEEIRADTRGLDSNVRLKPSGVEWLGDVPEHWELMRVKQVTQVLRGKFTHRPRNDPSLYDGPYPFIQTGEVASASKSITSFRQTLNERGLAVSKLFPAGTLVMTIAANIGDVAILDFEACFPDSVVGFVPTAQVERDFLYYLFVAMKPELQREAPVNTQGNLNVDRIGARAIALPPEVEQHAIVRSIEASCASLTGAIDKAGREVSLLREYRTRLIADVVTGKLDVREAAARLPDEAEEPEPLDEAEVEADAEESDAGNGEALAEEAEA